MTKLSKEVFIHTIMELLQNKGIDAEEFKSQNLNCQYTGITLNGVENTGTRPIINADTLYNGYANGKLSLVEVVDEIAKIFVENLINENDDYMQRLKDFRYVKNNLVIEVYDAVKNAEMLKSYVHKRYEDLAIVPKIHLGSHNDGQLVCAIPTCMLDDYDISNDELVELAIQNSQKIRPVEIFKFEDIILSAYVHDTLGPASGAASKEQMMNELRNDKDFMQCLMPTKTFEYVMTNVGKLHGAASVFYPGVLQNLYDNIGENFYLVPSSVHEMLIIPCSRVTGDSLNEIVYQVNRDKQVMRDEDILTDSVYVYDGNRIRRVNNSN